MILENLKAFEGKHCETTATGTLLKQIGIELSEPLMFGIGEGLSYIFWNMKIMDYPFIGGRVKPDALTENLCRNLGLDLEVRETTSKKKAWMQVKEEIDKGNAVGLKLDCYHLEYFGVKHHFAGHYVAMYGYDEKEAYLVDTEQQGGRYVKTSLESLALARSEKGPMSSRNLSYLIRNKTSKIELEKAIKTAIRNNSSEFLNPPITNIAYKGILKTSKEIKKWFSRSTDRQRDFQTTAMLMERAGTGGSIFRNLYRDFLGESYDILKMDELKAGEEAYRKIALDWKEVIDCFDKAGETEDVQFINQASEILVQLSEKERLAMEKLQKAFA
ncbi:MAG: BtrH N-terminal domain-containing protein [Bacteroidia bacterium]|nr:BtrH N-terminal domain-containing protein [Bacteroidia bacterium]